MWPQVQFKVSDFAYFTVPHLFFLYEVIFFVSYFFVYRCHGPKPPPNPEFTLKPKKKKSNHPSECTPGSSCPPCPELVWRSCLGHHVGAERMVGIKISGVYTFIP